MRLSIHNRGLLALAVAASVCAISDDRPESDAGGGQLNLGGDDSRAAPVLAETITAASGGDTLHGGGGPDALQEIPAPKPAKGKRRGKAPAAAPEASVAILMQTSRYMGDDGRPVARGRLATASVDLAAKLIARDHAREATEDEVASAVAGAGVAALYE